MSVSPRTYGGRPSRSTARSKTGNFFNTVGGVRWSRSPFFPLLSKSEEYSPD